MRIRLGVAVGISLYAALAGAGMPPPAELFSGASSEVRRAFGLEHKSLGTDHVNRFCELWGVKPQDVRALSTPLKAERVSPLPLPDGAEESFFPALSPDGTKVALIAGTEDRQLVYIVELRGAQEFGRLVWKLQSPGGG